MHVYLPIAEMPVNALLVLLLSGAVGFLSGLLGVGGGFIMTPILLFMGVPPPVAVATELSQVTASSVSGAISYSRRRLIDLRMAALLTLGGLIGGYWGVQLIAVVRELGQADVLVSLVYVAFLTSIGGLMLWESTEALRRQALGLPPPRPKARPAGIVLPLQMRFPRSGLTLSILPPLAIGAGAGAIGAIMGVGGGFLLVPAMIYLLRMPANVVVGTSLIVVLITSSQLTVQQSAVNGSVDLVLAAMLITGGVIGAQFGVQAGHTLPPERLRTMLGAVVLATGLCLLVSLLLPPGERYALGGGL